MADAPTVRDVLIRTESGATGVLNFRTLFFPYLTPGRVAEKACIEEISSHQRPNRKSFAS